MTYLKSGSKLYLKSSVLTTVIVLNFNIKVVIFYHFKLLLSKWTKDNPKRQIFRPFY